MLYRKGRDYASAREFFNLLFGVLWEVGMHTMVMVRMLEEERVNYEVFDVLSEYGISFFLLMNSHVKMILGFT